MQFSVVATSQTQFDHQRSRSNDGAEARLQPLYTHLCIALPMHALRAASRLFTTIPLTWSTTEKISFAPARRVHRTNECLSARYCSTDTVKRRERPGVICTRERTVGNEGWHGVALLTGKNNEHSGQRATDMAKKRRLLTTPFR